jgi:hypothetical protein
MYEYGRAKRNPSLGDVEVRLKVTLKIDVKGVNCELDGCALE